MNTEIGLTVLGHDAEDISNTKSLNPVEWIILSHECVAQEADWASQAMVKTQVGDLKHKWRQVSFRQTGKGNKIFG